MPTKPQASITPPPHLLGVLRSLWQWRLPILGVTAAGTILAIIISLLLPEYYTGSTSFLAISPDQISIDGVFGTTNNRMQFYGTGDDIDRLMAVAESDELVDFMVDSFHLYSVYEIDSTKQKAPVAVRREFLGNFEVSKTPRDAIELDVLDQQPERAAAMVRAAREKVNEISLSLIRGTQARTADGLRTEIASREKTLGEINDRISKLRETSGVYNTEAQSEALSGLATSLQSSLARTKAILNAYRNRGGRGARDSIAKYEIQLAGYESSKIELDSQLNKLNVNLGPIDNLEEERLRLNNSLSYDRIRLKQFEAVLGSKQRALEVIEEAKVPVIKSKPVRSLIVVGAAIFSFLFGAIGALLIDTGRRFDWSEIVR